MTRVRLGVSGSGYSEIHGPEGERVYVHRLAACVRWTLDDLRGCDVHHIDKNGWRNNPDNLEPIPYDRHRVGHLRDAGAIRADSGTVAGDD